MSYGREIKRIPDCDEITTKCIICEKEIHLKAGWQDPLNDNGLDEKFCCGHSYAIEYVGEYENHEYDFVIEKED